MNKNAVVLLLAVLFMAMLLVVVNQMLYSDTPSQQLATGNVSGNTSGDPYANVLDNNTASAQDQNSALGNLGSLPLAAGDSSAPSVPASALGKTEPSPWAKDVEQNNLVFNNNGLAEPASSPYTAEKNLDEQKIPLDLPPQQPTPLSAEAQANYNDAARKMLADSVNKRKNNDEASNGKANDKKADNASAVKAKEQVSPEPVVKTVEKVKEVEKATPRVVKTSGLATIVKSGVHFADKKMVLKVEGDAPFTTKWFLLTAPDRLVIDFVEPVKNLTAPKIPDNRLIKASRIGKQKDGYRLVLDLNAPVKVESKNDKAGNLEVYME